MEIITSVTDELYSELEKLTGQRVVSHALWDESLADALAGTTESDSSQRGSARGSATAADTADSTEDRPSHPVDEAEIDNSTSPNANSPHVDIDLYLSDGVYFELYSTVCFPHLDSNPITQAESIDAALSHEIQAGVWLDEIAVDDENQLVLVLSRNHQPVLYLMVAGWTVDGWEELPE